MADQFLSYAQKINKGTNYSQSIKYPDNYIGSDCI